MWCLHTSKQQKDPENKKSKTKHNLILNSLDMQDVQTYRLKYHVAIAPAITSCWQALQDWTNRSTPKM